MQGYSLPYPDQMRLKLIPDVFHQTKAVVAKKLLECTACSIILDIWSSKSMMGFVGFNLAGVTADYDRILVFLAITKFNGRHTGEAILAEYEEVIRRWKIPETMVSIYFA